MMPRREFLAALGAAAFASSQSDAAPKDFNVLFIAVDDLRPELGCYGNRHVISPNIDRLAARSLLFQRAYCQAAVCGASRASLLTGLRPDTTRVWGNKTVFRDVLPDVVTLPQAFKQAGFHTQSFGKVLHGKMEDERSWSVPAWPDGGMQAGMQYVDEHRLAEMRRARQERGLSGHEIPTLTWKKRNSSQSPNVPDNALQDGQVADRAVAALRDLRDQPFFLAVGFQKPHLPFTAPKRYFDLYDPNELPVADVPRPSGAPEFAFTRSQELRGYTDIPREGSLPPGKPRELVHGYYASVSYMDAQVGRVLDELDRLGVAERTAVVLFGDHGWHLGEQHLWAKANNYELDARVPMLFHRPGMKTSGRATDRLVELVDLYPTLCDVCGLEPDAALEGTSFMPLTRDPDRPWKAAAFTQYPRPYQADGNWDKMGRTMRTAQHRYTEWRDRTDNIVALELYEYAESPIEQMNVAGFAEYQALEARLAAEMKAGWQGALPASD